MVDAARILSAPEILGIAASLSLLAGWRLYATVFLLGLIQKFHLIDLPQHLGALGVLENPWIIGASGLGFMAEFFADKIPWLDSVWDTLHTVIRPVGGALLALAMVNPNDSVWQVLVFLLGGGAALLSHGAKASTRAVVNTSPEPFSNMAVSAVEDVSTAGALFLALSHPLLALGVAGVLIMLFSWIVLRLYRFVRARLMPKKASHT
jgi:Domain of unknown function (DUF4126)